MDSEIIKLFSPILIIGAWIGYSFQIRKRFVIGVCLFFASYAGFSSNFSLAYREVHQIIQLLLILVFIIPVLRSGKLLRVNQIFVGFLIFIIVSLSLAPFDDDAKSQLLNYLTAVAVTNYLFISLESIADLEDVLDFIAILSVLLSLIGIAEFLYELGLRVETTFSNPNYYGLFIGIGSCIVIDKWQGWKKATALIMILVALILSGSRSALFFPIFQLLYDLFRNKKFSKIALYSTGCIIALIFISSIENSRFTNAEISERSDGERLVLLKIAFLMGNDKPLTGVGWGRFINEFNNYSFYSDAELHKNGDVLFMSNQERRVTHNDYARILAELGWIGFIFSVYLSCSGFWLLIKNQSFNIYFLLPVWVGIILFSLTHNNMNGAFFWFFFALPFHLNYKLNGVKLNSISNSFFSKSVKN